MLVLSRKAGERIVTDYHGMKIVITICEIERGRVLLGVDAPRTVKVDRQEIADRRRAEERRETVPIGCDEREQEEIDTMAFVDSERHFG